MPTKSLLVPALIFTCGIIFQTQAVFGQSFEALARDNWHHWRGPNSTGVSDSARPPLDWSEEKNVHWKAKIDGDGTSTPIIWQNKVFILTAINTGKVDPSLPKPEDQPKRVFGITYPNTTYQFVVICLDRQTGRQLWRRTAIEKTPHEGHHGDADFASASPTTDGKRLYCWFGSAGLFCYDLQGRRLWERDLGKTYMPASLGEGCSPVIYKDKLIVVRDHNKQSYIEVLDARNGKTLWRKDRDEPGSWATPVVVQHSGKTQVVTAASNRVRSYDLNNGNVIWKCGGLTGNVTPCPIVEGDKVICMSGYKGYSVMAIPLTKTGDLTEKDAVIWSRDKGTPYIPSPVLYKGNLYYTQSNSGVLTSVDSSTGDEIIERTRLNGVSNIYASLVAANGHIYITGRNGTTLVLRNSDKLDVVRKNVLKERFDASPAIAGNQLFLRGEKHLYCISEGK